MGSACGDAHWSLERCYRHTIPVLLYFVEQVWVQTVVPGSQPHQDDLVSCVQLEVVVRVVVIL